MKVKTYSTLSTILSLIAISSSDKFQVVDHGPCLNMGPTYCQERVKNSFCSKITNKCFCKSNFVAIRERENITCKPLLTELKCGMDQECTDVSNSICHPGASECTCPAQTFYVAGLHSCESETFNRGHICSQCKLIGGRCYYRSGNGSVSNQYSHKTRNFCSCPGITVPSENIMENDENFLQCNKILVDIGYICDNLTRICRSQKSTCVLNEVAGYGICQCNRNSWPIFQKNLNFYECYTEQSNFINRNCKHCKGMDGICVNMNEDISTDSCICPLSKKAVFYDNIVRIASEILPLIKCITTNEMVNVKCDMQRIFVCIQVNENEFPSLTANIRKNQSKIFFSDRILPNNQFSVNGIHKDIDPQCYFSPTTSVLNVNIELCQTLLFDDRQNKMPCGINTVQYMNGHFYSGYVEIWNDMYIPDLMADKLFDVSCKSMNIRKMDSIGQAIDRSWPLTSYQIISREFQTDSDFLSFNAVDIHNRLNDYFLKFSPIRLQANINSNKSSFTHISADLCWAQNTSHIIPNQTEKWNIIYKGCAFKDSGFTTNFLQVYETPSITSALFPLFQISNSQHIFFKCIFRLCTNSAWCKTEYDCSTNTERVYSLDPAPTSAQDIYYITKSIALTIGHQKPLQSDSRLQNSLLECNYFWCVTKLKLAIISMVIGGIILLASAIFMLLCYRQKIIRDINICQRLSPRPLPVNTLNRQQNLKSSLSANYSPIDYSGYLLVPVGHRTHQCQPILSNTERANQFEDPCYLNTSQCNSNYCPANLSHPFPTLSTSCHNEIITINNNSENNL